MKSAVFSNTEKLMGNRFVISVVGENEVLAQQAIEKAIAEIRRIEKLLTTFSEDSQTNLINKNAGLRPVKIDKEVFDLIQRSQRIAALTDGAFDLSYGSVDKSLWNFDQKMTQLPDATIARERIRLIDYRNIELDGAGQSVFLKNKGMKIGFGGIGKGYAADKARELLKAAGVKSGVVNASGDLTTWGMQPDGSPWTVAIANPDNPAEALTQLTISDMAVATSGNYEKFVVIDGKKYSHTINPKTGFPVEGIKSVTIICPIAELADALATPVTILGVEAGLSLINQLRGVSCVIITDDNRIFTSKHINLL